MSIDSNIGLGNTALSEHIESIKEHIESIKERLNEMENTNNSVSINGVNGLIDILALTELDTIANLESSLSSGHRLSTKQFLSSEISTTTFLLYPVAKPPYMEGWKCCYDISPSSDFSSSIQTIEFGVNEVSRSISINTPAIGFNYFRIYFKFNKYKTNEEIKTAYSNTGTFNIVESLDIAF